MKRELTRAHRAAAKAAQASQERDQAIRDAHTAGATVRAIAVEVGLSSARVHQIIHGR